MYRNIGEKNFFQGGGRLMQGNSVLYCEPYIDLTPDGEQLYQFAVMPTEIPSDALELIDRYGPEEFGAIDSIPQYNWTMMDKNSILKVMETYMIAWDEITYSENFSKKGEKLWNGMKSMRS